MRKIFLFMMVSLDGFYEGVDHDLSWHHVDDEFNTFAAKQMEDTGAILFGRKTYQLMEHFWPTYMPEDRANEIVKEQMDTLPKYVFSKTLNSVNETDTWQHVKLFPEVTSEDILSLKQQEGKDIAVLGSSQLCVTLLEKGLLDEVRLMINPVVIASGTRLFEGLKEKIAFVLKDTRTFHNGNVLHTYTLK